MSKRNKGIFTKMILFDIIEALCFSWFSAEFFRVEKKVIFVILATCMQMLIFHIGYSYNNNGLWLTLSVISIMIIMLVIWFRKIEFDYFYITIVFNCFILLSSLFGYTIANVINRFIILSDDISFIVACIISKLILIPVTFYLINVKEKILTTFNIKKWKFLILFQVILISSITIVGYSLITNIIDISIMYILLFFLIFLSVFFFIMVYEMQVLNKKTIEYNRLQQLANFNKEKYNTIKNIRYEIETIEHRLYYIMMKINKLLENNDYDEVYATVQTYMNSMIKSKSLINTGNDIFDCILSLTINEIKFKGVDINTCMFISKNPFYDNFQFINICIKLINEFKQCSVLKININEFNKYVIIKLICSKGTINENKLKMILDDASKHMKCSYNLNNYVKEGVRLYIELEDFYD